MRAESAGHHGLSLIEIVIVLAIIGILTAIGVANMPRDRFAVNQAAEGLARDFQFIRLEAIRRNAFVGLRFLPDSNSYMIFEDANRDFTYNADDDATIKTVNLGAGGVMVSTSAPEGKLFDPRGIPTDFGSVAITLSGRTGAYSKNVCISGQGKPQSTQDAC